MTTEDIKRIALHSGPNDLPYKLRNVTSVSLFNAADELNRLAQESKTMQRIAYLGARNNLRKILSDRYVKYYARPIVV